MVSCNNPAIQHSPEVARACSAGGRVGVAGMAMKVGQKHGPGSGHVKLDSLGPTFLEGAIRQCKM